MGASNTRENNLIPEGVQTVPLRIHLSPSGGKIIPDRIIIKQMKWDKSVPEFSQFLCESAVSSQNLPISSGIVQFPFRIQKPPLRIFSWGGRGGARGAGRGIAAVTRLGDECGR